MKLDDKNITNEEREMARNINNFDGIMKNMINLKMNQKIIIKKNQKNPQLTLKIIKEPTILDQSLLKIETIIMSKI